MSVLTLAIPSKGRLMEQAQMLLEKSGFKIERIGSDRGCLDPPLLAGNGWRIRLGPRKAARQRCGGPR